MTDAVCLHAAANRTAHSVKAFLVAVQISEEFNVAVLVTNQVMSDPSGGAMFVVDPKKPLGGHVMAHASTVRLSLRKGKGEQRVMKVVDSPNLRKSACALATLVLVQSCHH